MEIYGCSRIVPDHLNNTHPENDYSMSGNISHHGDSL